jgi:hypothetical protein
MSFQKVFDNAESISIKKTRKVAQTISRDGVVKSISLGGQIWEFEVKLPNGPAWTTYRPIIEVIENYDRVTPDTVQINRSSMSWMTGYQGGWANVVGTVTASVTTASTTTLTIVSGPNLQSGFKFKSGDLIQLGTLGKVYSVVNDVPYTSNTVTLHRPIRDSTGTYTLLIGQNVTWNVRCVNLPRWTIQGRNRISWDGAFVFSEVI